MRWLGFYIVIAGVLCLAGAANMSVSNDGKCVTLDGLNIRQSIVLVGCTNLIVGVMLMGFGELSTILRKIAKLQSVAKEEPKKQFLSTVSRPEPKEQRPTPPIPANITCRCPTCGAEYTVPKEQVGKQTKCKRCGEIFRIQAQSKYPPSR